MNETYNNIKATMAKLCANNLSGVNNRAIDKLAAKLRYMEKFVRPEVKETVK